MAGKEKGEIIARKMIVRITNFAGQQRTFEVFAPDTRYAKILWEYDRDGEPINVRMVEAAAVETTSVDPPERIRQWEYKVIPWPDGAKTPSEVEQMLNRIGEEGWALCSSEYAAAIFMKEKAK